MCYKCKIWSNPGFNCTLYDGLSPEISAAATRKIQKNKKRSKKLYTILRNGLNTTLRIMKGKTCALLLPKTVYYYLPIRVMSKYLLILIIIYFLFLRLSIQQPV